MNNKLFHWIFVALFLSGCSSFLPYSTVDDLGKPTPKTIDTKLHKEEIGSEPGNYIKAYMSKIASGIDSAEGVTVKHFPEALLITVNSQFWFDKDSHTLKESTTCTELFNSLSKYPNLEYLLEVHTDGEGSRYYNQGLSERRAQSIREHLQKLGFPMDNLTIKAYGEDQPLDSNDFIVGKNRNRRIEIGIYASSALKEMARKDPIN